MARFLHPTALIPGGLVVDRIICEEERFILLARRPSSSASCPSCGKLSNRLHSRYQRALADLPSSGRSVLLRVTVRRFRCDTETCNMNIFAERFEAAVVERYARRTARLECIVYQLGLALGSRPGQSFARRLMLPVSKDTLLRVVRRRFVSPRQKPTVIGIDDWAYKRGQHYGTIICDLERRRVVALLPDREAGTIEDWLAQHSDIVIAARDRGGGYGEAIARALPDVVQVADRWHLMENASAAFLDAVRKSMRSIRAAIGSATINPNLLTYAERLQHEGYLRREETNSAIMKLAGAGVSIKEIVRRTGHSRKLVRQVLRGQQTDIFRVRQSSLETYLIYLDEQWTAGCHNASELWRHLKAKGFRGCLGVVSARRRRHAEQAFDQHLHKVPSARMIARLMTMGRDHLSQADTVMIAAIETGMPMLVEARALIDGFHSMIRKKAADDLEPWIARACKSLVASFANGIIRDRAAVRAAIVEPWSNGQTEGQITKLKLIKRQMYGRGKLDLLQARVIGAM